MDLSIQYEFVRSSREVLLNYCKSLSEAHFLTDHSSFGRGSIRNLLVHIGNMYESWIGNHALNKSIEFRNYSSITTASEAENYFLSIDSLIEEFLSVYKHSFLIDIEMEQDKEVVIASPLKLFTHVITHEFHHKGQILSLSRHLGYIPVDTDVIR